jgi:hypothetical protein
MKQSDFLKPFYHEAASALLAHGLASFSVGLRSIEWWEGASANQEKALPVIRTLWPSEDSIDLDGGAYDYKRLAYMARDPNVTTHSVLFSSPLTWSMRHHQINDVAAALELPPPIASNLSLITLASDWYEGVFEASLWSAVPSTDMAWASWFGPADLNASLWPGRYMQTDGALGVSYQDPASERDAVNAVPEKAQRLQLLNGILAGLLKVDGATNGLVKMVYMFDNKPFFTRASDFSTRGSAGLLVAPPATSRPGIAVNPTNASNATSVFGGFVTYAIPWRVMTRDNFASDEPSQLTKDLLIGSIRYRVGYNTAEGWLANAYYNTFCVDISPKNLVNINRTAAFVPTLFSNFSIQRAAQQDEVGATSLPDSDIAEPLPVEEEE